EGMFSLPAALGVAFSATVLFKIIWSFSPAAKRLGANRAVALLLILIVAMDGFLLICWRNSETVKSKYSAEIAATGRLSLSDLYETFPIQYGEYHVRTDRCEDGMREMRRLEKLIPGNPAVYVAESGLLLAMGNYRDARKAADKASSMRIRHPLTIRTLNEIAAVIENKIGAEQGRPN
ncbi:MAG TPA: hypothetical protein PLQ76_03560, partial [bacterium]|nr:hypothetical protein [bacterium]